MSYLAEKIADALHDNADDWEVATTIAPRVSTDGIEKLLHEAHRINEQKKVKRFDVIKWMTEHGHASYGLNIYTLKQAQIVFDHDGEYDMVERLDKKISEIKQEAQDRYDDWATD